jgi:glycosyltransferase involved in cell wall biosynthesis
VVDGCAIPTMTLGMPVYNGEALLESSIRSILDQTFTDFELVIVDDASRDGTEAICREFAAMDARIHYHRNPKNLGGSGNYNYVFSLAQDLTLASMWAASGG